MSTTPEDPFANRPEEAGTGQTPPPQPNQPYAQQPQSPQPGQQPDQQYAQPQYAQQPYVQQPQPYPAQQPYGQQPYAQPVGPRPGTEKNWMGTLSLVMSLLGLVTVITAIAGIVFGHLGRSAARRGEADNDGMSLAGLIIGYVITVTALIFAVFATLAVVAGIGFVVDECGGDDPADWCDGESTYTWDADDASYALEVSDYGVKVSVD